MAFDFYFAGGQAQECTDKMVKIDANILQSFINDRKMIEELIEKKKQGWKGKLLIDNGAFTVHRKGGHIDIDEYIDYINDRDEYCDYFIALDEIPGVWGQPRTQEQIERAPAVTWDNYLYMIERVNKPEILLPVFHQGDDFKWLETMLKHPTPKYICISGNKEFTNKQREQWYEECYKYINKLKPNIKVHCLGSATMTNAEKFPFTSMDATTWIMTGATGNVLTPQGTVYVGNPHVITVLPEDAKERLRTKCERYGINDIMDLGNDYKARMIFNICYLKEASDRTEYKGSSSKVRKLF
jgi:hypothetical protein